MKKYLILSLIIILSCEKEPVKFTLKVTSNPIEGGLVNPSQGTYNEGESVNIIAASNEFYSFDRWSGDWTGTSNSYMITMDSDKNITGNFIKVDNDEDGIINRSDECPNTNTGDNVNSSGCSPSQIYDIQSQMDDDSDGINNFVDECPSTQFGQDVNEQGCALYQLDDDLDGYTNDIDQCPNTPQGFEMDAYLNNGCAINNIYLDQNGVTIKAANGAIVGDRGHIDGVVYTIVDVNQLRLMIENNEDISKVVTSLITNMYEMFSYGRVVTLSDQTAHYGSDIPDISSWDVSNVTNMYGMFLNAFGFNGDLSHWNVSKVENMTDMFQNNRLFNNDIGNWDVSSVKNMSGMFGGGDAFDQDISSWDVSNVTNMSGMFLGQPFNQDISSWDVSNVNSMIGMFTYANLFNQDISSWDVSNVIEMSMMFQGSENFNQDLSSWNVSNVVVCGLFSTNTTSWTLPKPNFINCNPD